MKKAIITLCIIAVIALFGGRAWWLHQHRETGDNVVNIGILIPLSGITTQDGLDALAGIKIAQEEVNNGTDKFKINLLVEDNKHAVPATLAAYHKINDKSTALIVFGGVPTNGLASQLKIKPKPTIALVSAENDPIYNTPSIFRAWIPVPLQAQAIVNFIENTNSKRIAFLKIKSIDADIFDKALKTQLQKIGKEIIITETFSITDIETRNQVLKIMDKRPDIIVVYGFAQGYIAALNSLREEGYTGNIITNQNIIMHHNLLANHGNGMYFETPEYDFSKLTAHNTRLDGNLFAAFGYEAVKILAHVINENGTDPEKIRAGLANIKDLDTGFGKISYDGRGELYIANFVIKQMQHDGTAKIVKE